MRNILITVMMLIVAALLYTGIVANDNNGLKAHIENKATAAKERIRDLDVQ